jgi:hypothetical protein
MIRYFIAGFLIHACVTSLIQDFYGKEKYLKTVEEKWVDKTISGPLAIIGIITAIILVNCK